MQIEQIAKVCHQVNKAYCESIGDLSQSDWKDAPQWQKDSAVNGVRFHLENPNLKPVDSHNNWLKEKLEAGWKFGMVKDAAKKEHPCCVPYENLPLEQKAKDNLFIAVVEALSETN